MKGFKLTDLLGEQPPATTTNGGEFGIPQDYVIMSITANGGVTHE